jgi:hypothetical protein
MTLSAPRTMTPSEPGGYVTFLGLNSGLKRVIEQEIPDPERGIA